MLDTTHILPLYGLETSITNHREEISKLLKSESKFDEFIISDISLLEVRWLLLKKKKKEEEIKKKQEYDKRFRISTEIITNSEKWMISRWYEKSEIVEIADRILELGHKDYLDCLLVAQSYVENATFVTEDKKLLDLRKKLIKNNLKIKVINWVYLTSLNK